MSKNVRLGIVGIGNMGNGHLTNLRGNKLTRVTVNAICDTDPEKMAKYPDYKHFTDSKAMIRSGEIDAILVATPHYDHTIIGIDALEQGLHVMVEKPLSVHKADCERLIAAYDKRPKKTQLFACMFNQRSDPKYIKVRNLIKSGELGEIHRINWIITDWFRSEAYYSSGGWRATWKGEGGGVLANQCPHNLDLMQWLFGMPSKVRAHVHFGKWHNIETEDAVTAYLEYPNGATGVFITTTGEAPGTNRLEIAAERGRVVVEHGKINWTRNVQETTEYSRTTKAAFGRPETWNVEVPVNGSGGQHVEILQDFIDVILDGGELRAPGVEGINSVELGNSMILSGLTDKTVTLPMDSKVYEAELKKLIANSKVKKAEPAKGASADDFAKSYAK